MKSIKRNDEKIEFRFDQEVLEWSKVHKNRLTDIISWEVFLRKKILSNYLLNNYAGKKLSILEIGCGAGENVFHLSKLDSSWKIKGVDMSKNMISHCKNKNKNKNISFDVLNINNSCLNEKFDVILMLGVVGYIKNDLAFKQINKMLKKNSILLFTYGNKNSLFRKIRTFLQSIKRFFFKTKKAYFQAFKSKEIKKYLKSFSLIKQYDFCYGIGLGKWEIKLSKIIEKMCNYKSLFSLNLTRLLILRKK